MGRGKKRVRNSECVTVRGSNESPRQATWLTPCSQEKDQGKDGSSVMTLNEVFRHAGDSILEWFGKDAGDERSILALRVVGILSKDQVRRRFNQIGAHGSYWERCTSRESRIKLTEDSGMGPDLIEKVQDSGKYCTGVTYVPDTFMHDAFAHLSVSTYVPVGVFRNIRSALPRLLNDERKRLLKRLFQDEEKHWEMACLDCVPAHQICMDIHVFSSEFRDILRIGEYIGLNSGHWWDDVHQGFYRRHVQRRETKPKAWLPTTQSTGFGGQHVTYILASHIERIAREFLITEDSRNIVMKSPFLVPLLKKERKVLKGIEERTTILKDCWEKNNFDVTPLKNREAFAKKFDVCYQYIVGKTPLEEALEAAEAVHVLRSRGIRCKESESKSTLERMHRHAILMDAWQKNKWQRMSYKAFMKSSHEYSVQHVFVGSPALETVVDIQKLVRQLKRLGNNKVSERSLGLVALRALEDSKIRRNSSNVANMLMDRFERLHQLLPTYQRYMPNPRGSVTSTTTLSSLSEKFEKQVAKFLELGDESCLDEMILLVVQHQDIARDIILYNQHVPKNKSIDIEKVMNMTGFPLLDFSFKPYINKLSITESEHILTSGLLSAGVHSAVKQHLGTVKIREENNKALKVAFQERNMEFLELDDDMLSRHGLSNLTGSTIPLSKESIDTFADALQVANFLEEHTDYLRIYSSVVTISDLHESDMEFDQPESLDMSQGTSSDESLYVVEHEISDRYETSTPCDPDEAQNLSKRVALRKWITLRIQDGTFEEEIAKDSFPSSLRAQIHEHLRHNARLRAERDALRLEQSPVHQTPVHTEPEEQSAASSPSWDEEDEIVFQYMSQSPSPRPRPRGQV